MAHPTTTTATIANTGTTGTTDSILAGAAVPPATARLCVLADVPRSPVASAFTVGRSPVASAFTVGRRQVSRSGR